jgi:RimJ/RimL family protein N-acetyltransferase
MGSGSTTKTGRLTAIQLAPVQFFEYIKERITTQSERAYIDSIMIPGVLGPNPIYYTFWLGIDHVRELIVCEAYFKGEPVKGTVEIGYQVVNGFEYQGYTSEMVGLLVDVARGISEIRTLEAIVADWNVHSKRILEKNGFKQIAKSTVDGISVGVWHKKV